MNLDGDDSWRSPEFRQNMVARLREAMANMVARGTFGSLPSDDPKQIEQKIFSKASSRADYIQLLSKIFNISAEGARQKTGMPPAQQMHPGQMYQQQQQQQQQRFQQQQQQQIQYTISNNNQMPMQQQPQQGGGPRMAPGTGDGPGAPPRPQYTPTPEQQAKVNQLNQIYHNLPPQLQQQVNNAPREQKTSLLVGFYQRAKMQQQQRQQQQQQQQQNQAQMVQQSPDRGGQGPPPRSAMVPQGPGTRGPMPQQGGPPAYGGPRAPFPGPGPGQQLPPQQDIKPIISQQGHVISQPQPMGGPYISGPSPNFPGPSPSPGNAFGNGPSPGGSYSTPGASPVFGGAYPQQKPRAQNEQSGGSQGTPSAEDPAVKKKIEEMQIFLEPVKRHVDRIKRDGKNTDKIEHLVQILEGQSKLVTLDILAKCQPLLQTIMDQENLMIQPFFESVCTVLKRPNGAQSLKGCIPDPWASVAAKRIKAPTLDSDDSEPDESEEESKKSENKPENKGGVTECTASTTSCDLADLCGPPDEKALPLMLGEETVSEETFSIPMCIQREVASLDRRFGISMDESRPVVSAKTKFIHLVCSISKKLPSLSRRQSVRSH